MSDCTIESYLSSQPDELLLELFDFAYIGNEGLDNLFADLLIVHVVDSY